MQQALFKRGLPTDIDINRLFTLYPVSALTEGKEISYAEVERILHTDRRQHRFNTVTMRWRSILEKENGIFFKCVAGEKFVVCNNADKADMAAQRSREAAKKARRAVHISNHVDRAQLTEDQRKRFDTSKLFAAAVIGLNTVKKQQALPTI